jgi:hypothetical protein
VLREKPPMPVKCVTCGPLFRTSNDLDWHIREEHLQRATPPAKGAPVAAPAPVVGGTDQADGPPPPAEGRVRARRDRGGASRSPVVAQAVRPAATGTPVGAGSRRGLARDPCPRAAFELRQPADGLQPGGERIAGADVEARGEAVVEDSVAPPGK